MTTATIDRPARAAPPSTGGPGQRRGTALTVLSWLLALLFFFPILWMVLLSLRSESDAATPSCSPRSAAEQARPGRAT